MNSFEDIPKEHLIGVMDWFKHIKLFDGKNINQIAYEEKVFGVSDTVATIAGTHCEWRKLVSKDNEGYTAIRDKYHFQGVTLPPLPRQCVP